MDNVDLLEKLVDLQTVSLIMEISFFAYFLFTKWSKK